MKKSIKRTIIAIAIVALSPIALYSQDFQIETIRSGKDLTKWLEDGRVMFPVDMAIAGYTTTVKARAVLNRATNALEFVEVTSPTHESFVHELYRAPMPIVNPKKIEADTLNFDFDFDFSTVAQGQGLKRIESYTPPTIEGDTTPREWMREVLGAEICEMLYFRRVQYIAVALDINSLGAVVFKEIYAEGVDIPMETLTYPPQIWRPTIINGEAVPLSHSLLFEVESLLSESQRAKIDAMDIITDYSGKIYSQTTECRVDQMPSFDGGKDWGEWTQAQLQQLKEEGVVKVQSAEVSKSITSRHKTKITASPSQRHYLYNQPMSVIPAYAGYDTFDNLLFKKYILKEESRQAAALSNCVVRADVVIDVDGSVGEIKIVQSSDEELSLVATKLLKGSSGMWTPAIHEGKYVRCRLVVNVDFRD